MQPCDVFKTKRKHILVFSKSMKIKNHSQDCGFDFYWFSIHINECCVELPPPPRHPFSDFFFGEGAAVHGLSENDNPSSNCPSKFTDKDKQCVARLLLRVAHMGSLQNRTRHTQCVGRLFLRVCSRGTSLHSTTLSIGSKILVHSYDLTT